MRILDVIDFNDFGFDFWYEFIDVVIFILGKWKLVVFEGRNVFVVFDIIMNFVLEDVVCKMIVD